MFGPLIGRRTYQVQQRSVKDFDFMGRLKGVTFTLYRKFTSNYIGDTANQTAHYCH